MNELFQLRRGAHTVEGGVEFSVWAPFSSKVAVEVDDGNRRFDLAPSGRGVFATFVPDLAAGTLYAWSLDGSEPIPDPVSRHQPGGVHGRSQVIDPRAFDWNDGSWSGVELTDLVLYEIHVGTFTERGTFDGVIDRLHDLVDLGVTAIELMPLAQFPGERNWGYDGVFPYAPQSSYGGPDGLRRLVDAAHSCGIAVVLDVVYNHLGPEGNVLGRFGPYFTDRYRTPWGEAINFDGAGSDEVRRYFLDNALHWISEYHVDGLRLDAVHAICDFAAVPFLAQLSEAVEAQAKLLGRPVHLIAESDANDPRLVRRRESGGIGLDAVWSDDFHHAVHVALTGERDGYYADFTSPDAITRAVSDGFVYQGDYSEYRDRSHGAEADDIGRERFVVCVQNHDQIGNRAFGERLGSLVEPARLRLAAALLLCSALVPLLFMGEEYGETNPFLYFVDHGDEGLRRAVRQGRQREFEAFRWKGDIPDPAARSTFERSRLDPRHREPPANVGLRSLYTALLRLRREEPSLQPGATRVNVEQPDRSTILVELQRDSAATLFATFQLGPNAGEARLPGRQRLTLLLDTQSHEFGGPGSTAPETVGPGESFRPEADAAYLYKELT